MRRTLLALLLAVSAAACSGGGDPDPADLVGKVPDAIEEERTARLEMTVDFSMEGVEANVTGEGVVDLVEGAGWFDTTVLGSEIQMRTDGELIFVRTPREPRWLATSAEAAGSASFGGGPVGAIAFVDLLRAANDDVEELGEEEVRGLETTHVRVHTDVDQAIADAPTARATVLEGLAPLAPDGPLPMEVWLTDDGVPLRLRVEGEVEGMSIRVTVDLSSFGAELGVEIPPEGEIRDIEPDELESLFAPAP
ncbi:MAG TPA: hypothetical protein VEA78_11785 [Acidimicrobiales bacterium]|nr:hypothetical protein [Acidimicrobiales bacterium]